MEYTFKDMLDYVKDNNIKKKAMSKNKDVQTCMFKWPATTTKMHKKLEWRIIDTNTPW